MPLAGSLTGPAASAPIAVLGDARIEEPRGGPEGASCVGGSALRVAIDLERLGADAQLVAAIGRDAEGDRIRAAVREAGVPLLPSEDPELGSARVVIQRRRKKGDRYELAAGRRLRIRFDEVQAAAIARAPVVVVAGFPFDDGKRGRRLLAAIAQPHNRLVLDADPRIGLIEDLRAYRAAYERHASSALLVHLSSRDAELIFEAPIDEATSHLLDLGARHVLATEGSSGSRWVNRTGIDVHAPVEEAAGDIVDLVGAGDAVTAVAADALARSGAPRDDDEALAVLERAMRVAARVIRSPEGVIPLGSAPLRGAG